ncbi:MAG TPA: VIT domain-containing protein [Vicinamibacterales bacterium]|nr:VIT domain-containing protein [Vicinamibacterales bacterium]
MPEPLASIRAGLFMKKDAPVPLAGVSIDAEISTLCARVVITQRYVNRESTPIEAVYVFPLDEGSAVCGFEAIVDGTLVVGEVKERETAFKMYDEALERGDGAFLLDEERPDVFQANIGNLPPGGEVLLKITYVTELAVDGTSVRFSIPTTVSPRYAPPEDHVGIGRPDSETLNPPLAWRVPYGLDLAVRLTMPGTIGRVESPSHPISVSMNANAATVTLSQREAALDRDFVLSIDAIGLDVPQAWVERDDDGAETIAVGFVPTFRDASSPSEIIFLVDRSGSMQGTSITEVRNALQLCLRSMIPGCRFNIFGFGSSFDRLFPESVAYDERNLARASDYVAALEANLGGTEILPALQAVLDQPRTSELPRQVVVLTDGEVTNTDAVLALAARHLADTRIFTFGIGASASHHLVRGLARAGGGVAEFIYPGERIEPTVMRQFGRLLSPALTNVRVEWSGADVTQAPSVVPPVFSGGRLLLYGFMRSRIAGAGPARARLTANSPSGSISLDLAIGTAQVTTGRVVAPLAARARIRELEESPQWRQLRGSRQSARKVSAVTQEIVALAVRYGLMSRETSYVAVERREVPVLGDMKLRRIPIAVAAGWGGMDAVGLRAPMMSGLDAMLATDDFTQHRALERAEAMWSRPAGADPSRGAARLGDRMRPRFVGQPSIPRPSRASGPVAPPAMQILVRLQHADGSWDLTRELADAIGQELEVLQSVLGRATGDRRDIERAWATALALAWLRRHATDVETEWQMLGAKARASLDEASARFGVNTSWLDAAERFVNW